MPILNGPQFAELVRIIREAFSKTALEQLVKFRLNDDLFGRVTSSAKPVKDIAYDLITLYEQEEKTAGLLGALVAERERSIDLRALVAVLPIAQPVPIARPDTTGLPGRFGQGVAALPAAVQGRVDARVIFAIGKLSGRLAPCCDNLRWLSRYKGLHDGLHQLQGKLTAVEIAVRTFARAPEAERAEARELLAGHAVELARLAGGAQTELAPEPPLPSQDEEAEWVGVLTTAVAQFDTAVQADVADRVSDAVIQLRGLIRQTAVVNDHMLFLVRGLQLDQLSGAMRDVDKALGPANGREVDQFRAGLDAINRLGPDLTALVEEHDAWQTLEAQFALAATQAQAPPADRFAGWPGTRARLAALCAVNDGDPLAARVTAAAQAYDTARTGPKPDADRTFVSVRLAFTKMFFQIDGQLLTLAKQLAEQATALDTAAQLLTNFLAAPANA
jgi:hypothetical protein